MVSKLNNNPAMLVDYLVTYQLVVDPAFWAVFQPGIVDDLIPDVPGIVKDALEAAMGKTCAGCNSLRGVIVPFHNRLWSAVARVLETDYFDKLIAGLADYITTKRGYRPSSVVVYYTDASGAAKRLRLL